MTINLINENQLKGYKSLVKIFYDKLILIVSFLLLSINSIASEVTNTVTGTITYAGFLNPVDLAISNDGSKLLIADNSADAIFQADLATNTVNPALTFTVTYPIKVVVQPASKLGYALSPTTNLITVFNIETLALITTIPFSDELITMAMAPNGSMLYVLHTNSGANTAYVGIVDTSNYTVVNTITLNVGYQTQSDLIVSPNGHTLYISNITAGTITAIDLLNSNAQSTITSLPPDYPLSGAAFLAITPDGKKLCVGNGSNNWTSEVDLTTIPPTSAKSVDSNNSISFIAITPNGKTAYLSDQNPITPSSSAVDILDVAINTVVGSVISGVFVITNPNSIVITKDGSKGYVANGYNLSTSAIGYISIFNTDLIAPFAPVGLTGIAQANNFLTQTDLINTIAWSAPVSGITPVSYNIYRNADLTNAIATVSAASALKYYDHNRQPNTTYDYYVAAVSDTGALSTPASVSVRD